MTVFSSRVAHGDSFAQFRRPVVVANDNAEGPSPAWRNRWRYAHAYGAFDDDNGEPRQPSPAWDALLPEPANDNSEPPTGQAMARFPIMLRARKGEFCAGAVEAIEWLEGVLEEAVADPSAVPSASWLMMPEDAEMKFDESTGWSIPEGNGVDIEPTYGPTPQWWATNGGRITAVGRGRSAKSGPDELKAGRIIWVEIDGGAKLSLAERPDRIKGSRRPEKIEPLPRQLPGENDPAIAWTRICHGDRTGNTGGKLIPTPPAHYIAVAKRRISDLQEKISEKQLSILIRAVLHRESAEDIGKGPKVSHGRATAKGADMLKNAVDGLVDYYFDKITA